MSWVVCWGYEEGWWGGWAEEEWSEAEEGWWGDEEGWGWG